jgi:hypothetical protein
MQLRLRTWQPTGVDCGADADRLSQPEVAKMLAAPLQLEVLADSSNISPDTEEQVNALEAAIASHGM